MTGADLTDRLRALPTTSMLVLRAGRTVYEYGDTAQVSYLASARKSVLSMLYGRPVADGAIGLDRTIGELGIDDVEGLLEVERRATVRDLLTARSGVYHPAGSPGGETDPPERGSREPGTHFVYQNWDFNVLETIFERLTGRSVFDALRTELAIPLGFQDFDLDRQRLLGVPERSRHLAHHLFLSGRDLARLGQLMLHNGRQLVPVEWVKASTSVQVSLGPLDYGYLWWLPRVWPGSFLAAGNFGQYLFVLPSRELVISHRVAVSDEFAIARNRSMGAVPSPKRVTIAQFGRLVAAVLDAFGG
jgi:CubicO group peptidase (beta-lactamase class C family)